MTRQLASTVVLPALAAWWIVDPLFDGFMHGLMGAEPAARSSDRVSDD